MTNVDDLVFSSDYISSVPAVLMPVRELIAVCRKHGVLSLIDGAHTPGQVQLNLEELGADFYAGLSSYKKQMELTHVVT